MYVESLKVLAFGVEAELKSGAVSAAAASKMSKNTLTLVIYD
jgi:hypothetical protein